MVWAYVAVYFACVAALGSAMLFASWVFAPSKVRAEKSDPYECGVPVLSDTRERFSVRFYLIALLFILFDIETVFIVPWAVLYKKLGVPGLFEVGIFIAVLGFGLVYLWRRGGLEWD